MGFDSLYNSNNQFRKFVAWDWRTREKLHPHYDFLEKTLVDANYFDNIDIYPISVQSCNWRELGPLNHHDLNSGYIQNPSNPNARGIGPTNFISFDPNFETTNLMFTGSWASGLFYSVDGGESWISGGTDNFPPPVSAADCASSIHDEDVWFLVTGGADGYFNSYGGRPTGLYRTIDGGANWELIGSPLNLGGQSLGGYNYSWALKRVLIDPNSSSTNLRVFATGSKGIYRTENAMAASTTVNWENLYPENLNETFYYEEILLTLKKNWSYDIAYKQNANGTYDSNHLFATGTKRYSINDQYIDKGYILHSINNGQTWTELIPENDIDNLFIYQRLIVRTTPADPDVIYFNAVDSRAPIDVDGCFSSTDKYDFHLFKYNINDGTWSSSESNGWNGTKISSFDVSPIDKNLIHSGDCQTKNFSENGGVTWPNQTLYTEDIHADVEEIQFQPDGSKIWYCHHGGISVYDIATDIWSSKNIGLNGAMVIAMSMSKQNPEKILIGLDHDGTMYSGGNYSNNELPKWKRIGGGDGQDPLIDPMEDDFSYSSSQNISTSHSSYKKNTNSYESLTYDWSAPLGAGMFGTSIQANKFSSQVIYTPQGGLVQRHMDRGSPSSGDWEIIGDFSTLIPNGKAYKVLTSDKDEDLMFALVLSYIDTDGDGDADEFNRKVFANNKALNSDASIVQSSWFEIPEVQYYSNHWAADIISDPNNVNIFYVLHGAAPNNGNLTMNKIIKYTYTGSNLVSDLASSIQLTDFVKEDYTFNLPNIAVKEILIIPGSRDFIIASNYDTWITDQSKIDNALSNDIVWERLGIGLPHVDVSTMEVAYEYNLIRVGLKGRGVWEHCLPCVKKEGEIVISEDLIIDNFARYSQDIKITSNSTVTITGEVQMVTGTSITIENGSTLTIDGGTITNACDDFWDGIYVKGDITLNQVSASNMGILRVKNGGIISNAYVAVHNFALKPNGNTDWSSAGGIIYCYSGAQFINNKKDVGFISYQNYIGSTPLDDKSYFRETSFITDDQLIDGSTNILGHVTMYKTNGVKFRNCYFSSNDQYKDVGATGIYAVDADFSVTDYNDNPTIFHNLKNGIIVENYDDYYTVDINHSKFEETPYGIKLLGVQEASVTENTFTVESSDITPYGLYMLECSGYKVEENKFYGDNPDYSTGLGVVVKNYNMEADNEIYRNEFFDLSIGILVNGKNGSTSTMNPIGLELLCNRYDLNQPDYYDFAMTDKGIVSFFQGNSGPQPQDPAGNIFSHNTCANENSLFVSPNSYSYIYFHHSNIETTPSNGCYTYAHITPAATYGILDDWDLACPSNLNSDHESELPGKTTLAENSSLEIESLTSNYETVVDGGDQSSLLQSVNDPLVTSLSLRNELITNSPYISDEVLIASVNREPELNHWHLAEVIISNSPVSNTVWTEFDLNTTMPDFLYNHVLSYQVEGSISPRGELEIQIKEQIDIKEKASSDFVRGQMKIEDNEQKNQEIIDFYELDDSKIAVRRKVAALVSSGNYDEARTVLSVYDDESEYDAYAVVQEIIININEGIDSLTQVDKEALYVIANGEKHGKYRAQAILVDKDDALFDHPIVLPDPSSKSLKTSSNRRNIETTPLLASYPNPADEKLYFIIQLPAEMESAYIEIFTIDGKFVQQIDIRNNYGILELETSNLNSGMYISTLLVDKQKVSSHNFVINH